MFICPPGVDRSSLSTFNKKHYRMSIKYDMDSLSKLNQYVDTFIVGSDQLSRFNTLESLLKIGDRLFDSPSKILAQADFVKKLITNK